MVTSLTSKTLKKQKERKLRYINLTKEISDTMKEKICIFVLKKNSWFFKRVCLDIPYSIFSFSTMLIILAGCTRRYFVKPNILLLFVKFFPLKNQEFFFRTNIPIFSFIVSEISFVKFMYLNFLSFCFLRVLLVRDVTI